MAKSKGHALGLLVQFLESGRLRQALEGKLDEDALGLLIEAIARYVSGAAL